MTSGSGVMLLNNVIRGGVTEKVTFGKDMKVMREQAFPMSRWGLAGHGWGERRNVPTRSWGSL